MAATERGYTGAEDAVIVAECGLGAWRQAKLLWLDAFAAHRIVESRAAVPAVAGERELVIVRRGRRP